MKIKIYAGLSVTEAEVKKIIPTALFSGPIERSQVYDDIKNKVNVIGIIDGKFLQSLAVSPSELMDAMRSGIRVYGSSSIGAARAVELRNYGMIGCGQVYEHICAEPYFRDDWLGQMFFDDAVADPTPPFIDFYFGSQKLVEKRKISAEMAKILIKTYDEIYFTQRTYSELKRQLEKKFPRVKWDPILGLILKLKFSQKSLDGLTLLKKIKADLESIRRINSRLS